MPAVPLIGLLFRDVPVRQDTNHTGNTGNAGSTGSAGNTESAGNAESAKNKDIGHSGTQDGIREKTAQHTVEDTRIKIYRFLFFQPAHNGMCGADRNRK